MNKKDNPKQNQIQKIFDMIDLFYANKHMYDRLRKQDNYLVADKNDKATLLKMS